MRKIFFLSLWLLCGMAAMAKEIKPDTITWLYYPSRDDTTYYAQQIVAWQKRVDANNKDEWAWRNLALAYKSYNYKKGIYEFNQWDGPLTLILRKMEEAIPNTFTFELCCLYTRTCGRFHGNVTKAIELMPEDIYAPDLYLLIDRYINLPEYSETTLRALLGKAYLRNTFSMHEYQYCRNLLQSVEPNGILFTSGSFDIAALIQQEVFGMRKDVTLIPIIPLLNSQQNRDTVYKRLGIEPFRGRKPSDKDYNFHLIRHIITKSKRPAYFDTYMAQNHDICGDSLYNEGLLLKYSNHPYNNYAVALHNVRSVYYLDYLTEPVLTHEPWHYGYEYDFEYVFRLSYLVKKFELNGEQEQADRLYNILYKSIQLNTSNRYRPKAFKKLEESTGRKSKK